MTIAVAQQEFFSVQINLLFHIKSQEEKEEPNKEMVISFAMSQFTGQELNPLS